MRPEAENMQNDGKPADVSPYCVDDKARVRNTIEEISMAVNSEDPNPEVPARLTEATTAKVLLTMSCEKVIHFDVVHSGLIVCMLHIIFYMYNVCNSTGGGGVGGGGGGCQHRAR